LKYVIINTVKYESVVRYGILMHPSLHVDLDYVLTMCLVCLV